MKLRTISVVIAVTMLSGCAGLMHNNTAEKFNSHMVAGDYLAASQLAIENAGYDPKEKKVDDLLWAIEAGASLSYAGQYDRSIEILDLSERMMKSEDQEGVMDSAAETGLSMLGNDAMMDYEQTQYDGVMTNTIKAWNFTFNNELADARVEWNRAAARL